MIPGEATEVDDGAEKRWLKPARLGGMEGFVFADAVGPLVSTLPAPADLWANLLAALPAQPTGTCAPVMLVADLFRRPGEELLVYALGDVDCQRWLGIFDSTGGELLFSRHDRVLWEVAARVTPEGPKVLQLAAKSLEDDGTRGGSDLLFYLDREGAGFAPVLELIESRFELSPEQGKYTLTRLEHLRPAASKWLLQHSATSRLFKGGKDLDKTEERSYEFGKDGFVEVPRPAGVGFLPLPEPTITEGIAPMTVGE